MGWSFDFSADGLNDLKALVEKLIEATPDIHTKDPEEIKHEQEWNNKISTWHYKLFDKLSDLSISFTPFEWHFTTLWLYVGKPKVYGKTVARQVCNGIVLGPFIITWW